MTRSGKRILTAVWSAAAAAYLLGCCGPASAQQTGASNARVQAAHADWRRLSQTEVDCVEQALRAQRTNLWNTIQRGVSPNDAAMAKLRAACRTPARADSQPRPAPAATQALASVDAEASRRNADRLEAEKAAEKALAEKVAAEVAAAKKASAERIAAAQHKAAADKAAADKIAAEQAAAVKAQADKAAADEAAAKKAPPEKPKAVANADAERPATETIQPPAAEQAQDAAYTPPPAGYTHLAWESRMSFVYGLIIGPVIFCFGGLVFLSVGRRSAMPAFGRKPTETLRETEADHSTPGDRAAFDRLVMAVVAELQPREKRPEPRDPRDAGLH